MEIILDNKIAQIKEYKGVTSEIDHCQCYKDCNCNENGIQLKKYHYFYVKSKKGKKGLKTNSCSEAFDRFNFLNTLQT
mgnify:FL=1|tara:strand:- start:940 stop:1173 length:234 start_codon:yes stop_codon:yes gene_type:complete